MEITNKQKQEIVRLFLNGSNLDTITHLVKLERDQVIHFLFQNEITRDTMMEYTDKFEKDEFVLFFSSSKAGRPKLSENKKRKVKQIRLSNEEIEQLGNPNSTQMRNMLFELRDLKEFCKMLDEKGIDLIPDEWLEKDYDKNDPFWKSIYSDNYSKLRTIIDDKRCWDDI